MGAEYGLACIAQKGNSSVNILLFGGMRMDNHTYVLHSLYLTTKNMCMRYRWVSWSVDSLPEGKSRGLCLVQLCAKYRLVSATSSLLPLVPKGKRSCFSQGERFAVQLPLDCVFALRK